MTHISPNTLLDINSLPLLAALLGVAVLAVHVVPYILDPYGLRNVPGPFWAKFTDLWLVFVSGQGHRSEVVHELHKKYGPLVRIAPNHVSIADPDALQAIYGHSTGTTKSNFYDAFVSIARGLFTTRDRVEHTRKRKIVSHIFSPKNVAEFEPNVQLYVGQLIERWDHFYDLAVKGGSGKEGEGGWYGRDGRLWLDCLPWYNYLAFDIIGDLAFGTPFGMIYSGKDAAAVAVSQEDAMASYGKSGSEATIKHFPAVKILNDRGEYSATMGVAPVWMRPYLKVLPWFNQGRQAVQNLAGIAIAAVLKRLGSTMDSDRVDLLTRLRQAKDEDGKPMGRQELTAEALTQLIAGSDTTSNTSCAITYHLAANPDVQRQLHAELDAALAGSDSVVTFFEDVKALPYLDAVINEALRVHSTSGIGLPRTAPKDGVVAGNRAWVEGTVLSVPTYTIHRDEDTWGKNVDAYDPQRWEGRVGAGVGAGAANKDGVRAFNPFSYGPRACVGKNLASMELLIIISSILRRYEFVLEYPEKPFKTNEGFLRKPLECRVGIKRRETI